MQREHRRQLMGHPVLTASDHGKRRACETYTLPDLNRRPGELVDHAFVAPIMLTNIYDLRLF